MIEESSVAEVSCLSNEGRSEEWLPLSVPCLFQGRHFVLDVRAKGGGRVNPIRERDVRVRAPLCLKCRAPMEIRYRVPAYDCYACPSGHAHDTLFCARSGEGLGLFENVARHAAQILTSADPEARLNAPLPDSVGTDRRAAD